MTLPRVVVRVPSFAGLLDNVTTVFVWLRREFSARWMIALDAPVEMEHGNSAPSLHELLAGNLDTAQAVAQREMEAIASAEAAAAFAALNDRERVALLARAIPSFSAIEAKMDGLYVDRNLPSITSDCSPSTGARVM